MLETNIIPIGLDGDRKIIYSSNKKSYKLFNNKLIKCGDDPFDFDNYCSASFLIKAAAKNNFVYLEDEIIIQNKIINKINSGEINNDLIVKIPADEIIQSIYLNRNEFIITDKNSYQVFKSSINTEECSKYADIECIYELKLNKVDLNNVLFINNYNNNDEYSYIDRDGFIHTSKLRY